jgi:RNA polymerase sigma factor (sigma-70 family)
MGQPTDKELLLACRRGDESAWEALVNRYQRLMYAIPRRAGLDEDKAADVFQEVFTTLFQKLNDIDDPERLHAWLVTTARRKTLRLISTERVQQQRSFSINEDSADPEFEKIRDEAPLADEVMLQLEEHHLTRVALATLDERCRKLLTLLFYGNEQPSYAAIADALGTSVGSIGPTRARCLEKMLRLLEK